MENKIYCEDCKKFIEREFRFTDWENEYNDVYGNWEECKELFDNAVKENPTGRYSIYAVTICEECGILEDDGVLFNEECPEYKFCCNSEVEI